MVNICSKFIQTILPQQCLLCQGPCRPGDSYGLCRGCLKDLPWNISACQRCALPLPVGYAQGRQPLCGQCLSHAPPFQLTHAAWRYAPPMDYLIQQIKFHGDLACTRTLGELLAISLKAAVIDYPDLLVPVPLHSRRLRERGFNQALEIARPISRLLNIPIDSKSCQRVRSTGPQSDLPLSQRQANIRNAFVVSTSLQVQHVAIVDDVMTSGHTVSALASELLKQGVERISVWCCARTAH